jgi:hypothetical protein
MTMIITQAGSTLSGTFTEDGLSGGTLSGTVKNSTVSASLILADLPDCQLVLAATIAGDTWSGTEHGPLCTGPGIIGNPGTYSANFIRTR